MDICILVITTVKKLLERFMKKGLKKSNQKIFRVEKSLRKKAINYIWNDYDSSFNSWIDKKIYNINN